MKALIKTMKKEPDFEAPERAPKWPVLEGPRNSPKLRIAKRDKKRIDDLHQ